MPDWNPKFFRTTTIDSKLFKKKEINNTGNKRIHRKS